MKNIVNILLPYGIFDISNLQYKAYIDEAISQLNTDKNSTLILCGGLTKDGINEAKSIGTYYIAQRPNSSQQIFYEDKSITTTQNLEFASHIVKLNQLKPNELHVICDSIRVPKVFFFALVYFADFLGYKLTEEQILLSLLEESVKIKADFSKNVTITYKNISIHGITLNRSASEISQQIISSIEEISALKYPAIEAEILRLRNIQWQQETS